MRRKIPFSYVPALRWKKGEYCGLARLGSDVAERIAPRLVVPPSKDRDPEKGDEILYVTGRRIGEYWPMRPAFLDVHFLFPEFGEADSADWLLRILKVALDAGACPIPVATLSSLLAPQGKAFQLVLAEQGDTRIALRVESGEIDAELGGRVAASMGQLGTNPQDCALILDFADADLSDAEAVAKIALHALERVHSIGLWQQVIFQGSNYPERNPAINDSSVTVDRTEWHAWRSAIGSDSELTKAFIFGDSTCENFTPPISIIFCPAPIA